MRGAHGKGNVFSGGRCLCVCVSAGMCWVCCLLLTIGGGVSAAFAATRDVHLSLIHYSNKAYHPQWLEDGAFATILRLNVDKDVGGVNYLAKQTNLTLNSTLHVLKKKVRFAFSPQVVLKPFFAVREVEDMLAIVRSKLRKNDIQIDENFQAKTLISSKTLSSLKKINTSKPFALSPYQNRIYGLHFQINW